MPHERIRNPRMLKHLGGVGPITYVQPVRDRSGYGRGNAIILPVETV